MHPHDWRLQLIRTKMLKRTQFVEGSFYLSNSAKEINLSLIEVNVTN